MQVIIFKVQVCKKKQASTHPNMPCHTLCRNQRLPSHTYDQFPIQIPPISSIPHSSSMHIPEPSALMLIVKTSSDFSIGEEEVFGPWFAVEGEGWVGAVVEDVEAGLAEVSGDVVDPSDVVRNVSSIVTCCCDLLGKYLLRVRPELTADVASQLSLSCVCLGSELWHLG